MNASPSPAPNQPPQGVLARFSANSIYFVTAKSLSMGRSDLAMITAALAAGVKVVQVREKFSHNAQPADLTTLPPFQRLAFIKKIRKVKKLTAAYQALFLLNDYLPLALDEADGVHLGQDDTPLNAAFAQRQSVKREHDFIIGLSTHQQTEIDQALLVARQHPNFYINIGPIYPTQTKAHLAVPPLGPATLKILLQYVRSQAPDLPITVMGGIKWHHFKELLHAGASHFAMVTEITTATNVTSHVKGLLRYIRLLKKELQQKNLPPSLLEQELKSISSTSTAMNISSII